MVDDPLASFRNKKALKQLRGTASGRTYVTREAVLDYNLKEDLDSHPLWQCDPVTENWFLKTSNEIHERSTLLAKAEQELDECRERLRQACDELSKDLPPQIDGTEVKYNGQPYETIRSYDVDATALTSCTFDAALAELTSCTFDAALAEWKRRLLEYVATHKGDICVWRERPEVSFRMPFDENYLVWRIYARLCIPRTP